MAELSPTALLWLSNLAYVGITVVNTVAWGFAIRQVGAFDFSLSFVWKLGTNLYFLAAVFTALVGVFVTYVGRYSIGLGKAGLFYGVGTIALILTSHLVFGEKFDNLQIIGAALVLGGAVLLLQ